MKTRKQYMAKQISHAEYYGQFASAGIKAMVLREFTIKELLSSPNKDGALNDLALERWDRLAGGYTTGLCREKLREAGDFPSLGVAVCILKEAAKQIIASHQAEVA